MRRERSDEDPTLNPLSVAPGRYRQMEALFADPQLLIEPFPVISRAFAPMVRTQRFDVSEMAVATFLMARAAGSDLVLLPVVMAARFQNGALLRRAVDDFGPAGLWLRGILQEEYGLAPDGANWVTFEGAHVASYRDPPWAERAPAGSDMLAMLRDRRLDAAISGNDVPSERDLATVFPDPEAAADAFLQRHGFMPVNHMVVVRAEIARRDGLVRSLLDRFRAAGNPFPCGRQPAASPASNSKCSCPR